MTKDDQKKESMEDVAPPGKTAPDTSARPILVTHRPMVEDPMVKTTDKPDNEPEKSGEQTTSAVTHSNKILQPLNKTIDNKSDSSEAEAEKPVDENANAEAVVDAVAEQAEPKPKSRDGELSKEDKAKQEHVQKLIADKTYFVPIGQIARRRNRRAMIIFIVLLLLVAGGYLAIDAGIIKTNIKLPLDLIKN